MDGTILESQKHSIIVCILKTHKPTSPEDYRPLTLMKSDFKLLSKIIANILRPWLNDLLHPSQYCGVLGNNILGALAAIWETIAHAELPNMPTCILSIDFRQAFDNIAHSCLYAMLENLVRTSDGAFKGYTNKQRPLLPRQRLYIEAPAHQLFNKQGCPLSMLLFTLCLDPLLRTLHNRLTTSSPGSYKYRAAVLAYADDVTIILRSPQDAAIVQEEISKYEAASGAKLNISKSKAMALGPRNTAQTILGIQNQIEMRVLGIHVNSTVRKSAASSWATVTDNIRRQARDAYCRDLNFHQRIRYVQTYLMAKAWYTAQVFPPPADGLRQINTAVSWYLWRGEILRVPLSTLYKRKEHGGWALTHVAAKCRALLLYRLR
jgi:hypothetical protein